MRHFTTVTAFLASFLLVGTGVALACGNSYRFEMEKTINNVVNAERLLDKGMYAAAVRAAKSSYAKAGTSVIKFTPRSKGEQVRATRVVAVATVRLDGLVDIAKRAPQPRNAPRLGSKSAVKTQEGPTQAVRAKRMTWAEAQLSVLHNLRPADAELQARWAEAVAKVGDGTKRATALAGLEKLEAKDMMPDAMAWVTLATLQAQAGKVEASTASLEGCKRQARDAKICVLGAPGQG